MDALVFGVLTWSRFILLLSFSPTYIYSFTTSPKNRIDSPRDYNAARDVTEYPPPLPSHTSAVYDKPNAFVSLAARHSSLPLFRFPASSWLLGLIYLFSFEFPLHLFLLLGDGQRLAFIDDISIISFFPPFSLLTAIPKGSPPQPL